MINATSWMKRKARLKAKDEANIEKTESESTQSAFDKIFKKMTKEEQEENLRNSLQGMHIYQNGNTTILMGSDAMDRYLDFQRKMIEKYSGD